MIINWIHPFFFKTNSAASENDTNSWLDAINDQFVGQYWKTACQEVATLEGMDVWDMVDKPHDKTLIDSTWEFKFKQCHNGVSKKF